MSEPYQYASVVLGPIGIGQEIGRSLFGSPKPAQGEPPANSTGGILLILGGVAILLFAIYMFSTRGGAKLFASSGP